MKELKGRRIAIPGRLTTASLLLQLYDQSFSVQSENLIVMPFDKIIESVANGETDAGLIIHESRFTYKSKGLKQIIDLGECWEKETGRPIPLGGILTRRSLGESIIKQVESLVKSSVQYAFAARTEPLNYIKEHSQELSDAVINQHINLYVNDFSVDLGSEGEKAIADLFSRAEFAGILPKSSHSIFI